MRRQKITGPTSHYRGKIRSRPISVVLTPEGHAALAAGYRHARMRRQDYIERVLRRAAASLLRQEDAAAGPRDTGELRDSV